MRWHVTNQLFDCRKNINKSSQKTEPTEMWSKEEGWELHMNRNEHQWCHPSDSLIKKKIVNKIRTKEAWYDEKETLEHILTTGKNWFEKVQRMTENKNNRTATNDWFSTTTRISTLAMSINHYIILITLKQWMMQFQSIRVPKVRHSTCIPSVVPVTQHPNCTSYQLTGSFWDKYQKINAIKRHHLRCKNTPRI